MNAVPLATPRPLSDLLGSRWQVGARAAAVAWDGDAGLAAFGLSDGTLALALLAWEGAAALRPRDAGGVELVPASAAPPPAARLKVHDGACLALARDPHGGFLSGGSDGQFCRVQPDGVIDTLARTADPVAALACGPGGWRVGAAGRSVLRLGAATAALDLPNAACALAVAPDGSRVAIGHAGGVTLWAGGDTPRRLAAKGIHTDLAWSADARRLASATRAGDVFLWDIGRGAVRQVDEGRAMRRALGFVADGTRLVTSASGMVACWDTTTLQLQTCGVGSKDAVLQVACHPRQPFVAAGYANGTVLLCRPGSTDVLFVRGAGGGGIDALAWSPDGGALAFALSGGEIGLSLTPDLLFRTPGGAAP